MSLYGNFTLKEWLAIHCTTEDVNGLFRKALKNNDSPMAVLALAELIKRGDTDLIVCAIYEAVDAGCFTSGSRFSTVFFNALAQCGNRNPALRHISKNVRKKGSWPKTAAELIEDADAASCECSTPQDAARDPDNRLDRFLESFLRDGWFLVEFGFFAPDSEWVPYRDSLLAEEHCVLVIRDGRVVNEEEIPRVLNILDAASIIDALPEFDGEELRRYTLDCDGSWTGSENSPFYMTYCSVSHSLR